VELKETARFNVRSGSQDRALEGVVVKTIAGFLNANGGTLVIGVDDDGTPVGVERDLATLPRPDRDGYEQFLRSLLNVAIGRDLSPRVTIEFPTVDGVVLCAVSTPGSGVRYGSPRAVIRFFTFAPAIRPCLSTAKRPTGTFRNIGMGRCGPLGPGRPMAQ
jgi:hypothetical protein